jgi:hypothetical protein
VRKNIQYLSLAVWLISFNMISSFIHFPPNDIISFFYVAE